MSESCLVMTQKVHGVISLLVLMGSLFFWQATITASILFGSFLIWFNFWVLKKLVTSILEKKSSKKRIFALLIGKYFLWVIALAGAIIYFDLHVVGLLVGMSILMIAMVLMTLREWIVRWNMDLHGTN